MCLLSRQERVNVLCAQVTGAGTGVRRHPLFFLGGRHGDGIMGCFGMGRRKRKAAATQNAAGKALGAASSAGAGAYALPGGSQAAPSAVVAAAGVLGLQQQLEGAAGPATRIVGGSAMHSAAGVDDNGAISDDMDPYYGSFTGERCLLVGVQLCGVSVAWQQHWLSG
jgi:hypothetical protein